MEYVQQEARTQIAAIASLSTSSEDKPVYQSTTVPILNNREIMLNNVRSQFLYGFNNNTASAKIDVSTTATQTNASNTAVCNNGATCVSAATASTSSAASTTGDSESVKFSNFTNLPKREPVDLQFKDITYTVNLGFRKGEFFLN